MTEVSGKLKNYLKERGEEEYFIRAYPRMILDFGIMVTRK